MFCSKCGREAPNNASVCPYCGNPFNGSAQYNTSTNSESGCFKKIASTVSAIGTIIGLLFCLYTCTHDSSEMERDFVNLASSVLPIYSETIKNSTPPGYNTSLTYGQAFSRYFENGKWSDETRNSEPIVRFTGIFNNGDGTYSKAEVIFDITDMENGEFYYNIDTVIIDGLDLGWVGIYGLIEDVFDGGTSY